jgi:hypothetical protein
MMASAQLMIEERKRALQASGIHIGAPAANASAEDKARKIQELQVINIIYRLKLRNPKYCIWLAHLILD